MTGPSRLTMVAITVLLLVLLGISVGVSYLQLGVWSPVIGFGIAATKALLVAMFFMHLRYEARAVRLFAMIGLLWLGILIIGTTNDYLTRGDWTPGQQQLPP